MCFIPELQKFHCWSFVAACCFCCEVIFSGVDGSHQESDTQMVCFVRGED